MKIIFVYLTLFSLLLLVSCRSLSIFESPNSLRNIEGTVYLQNKKTVKGKINVQTENLFGSPIKVYTEEDKKPMQFGLSEIKGYAVEDDFYELKEIRESLTVGRRLMFMKRLTPENSRIHLYEFMRKEIVNKTSTRHESEYYIKLPGEEGNHVYAADGSRFVPHFEEKVSKMVNDCPALAQKIAAKQHGYFYAQVSLVKERKLDVLMKIIEEYNQCKK